MQKVGWPAYPQLGWAADQRWGQPERGAEGSRSAGPTADQDVGGRLGVGLAGWGADQGLDHVGWLPQCMS